MYVVANRVPVREDWREEFETRFRHRAGELEAQQGFVRMEILRPADETSPYVVLTTWRDEAAFNAWVGSDDFRAAHSNPLPKDAFSGASTMERHQIVITAVGEQ